MNEETTAGASAASGTGRALLLSIGGWALTGAVLVAEIGLAAWIAATIGPQSIVLAVLLMIATAAGAIAVCIRLVVRLTRRSGRARGNP